MSKLAIAAVSLIVLGLLLTGSHQSASHVSAQAGDKAIVLPNPNRDSFDGFGNQFDYLGNLKAIGSCNPSPISGQKNPYCTDQAPEQVVSNGEVFTGK